MSMIEKEFILSEIRKLHDELGRPPGQKAFEKVTGIPKSYWNGNYWPRWSDALRDAGFEPNSKNPAIPIPELIDSYLILVEELGAIPTHAELRLKANNSKGFPAASTFIRQLGPQPELLTKVLKRATTKNLAPSLLKVIENKLDEVAEIPPTNTTLQEGTVYLLRSGKHFKIGRSSEIERRVKQISVSMPEKVELEHAIQTDDTVGIEKYWHNRFSEKRMNGEWFNLSPAEVRAFKRRKFQ